MSRLRIDGLRLGGRASRRAVIAALACGALLSVVGAAIAAPPTPAEWAAIEAAAKKEGQLMVYHNIRPQGAEALMQDFRKAYPAITAEQMRLGSAPLIERYSTEFAAGRNVADVMITFPDERVFDGLKAGWMAEWTPPQAAGFPKEMNVENKMFAVNQAREAIVWNTQRVKAADAPKEWADLFDPKWKGKIGMNPPWRSVSVQSVVALWEDKLGIQNPAQKLKDLDVRFFEGSSGIIQAIIRGDVQVAELSDLPLNPMLEDGAPIGFSYPKAGTTVTTGYVWAAGKAPHPNAAKVFVNWLLSAEGQKSLQTHGGLSATRPGTPPLSQIPATAALPNTVEGLTLIPPERQKKMIDEWRTVFGVR